MMKQIVEAALRSGRGVNSLCDSWLPRQAVVQQVGQAALGSGRSLMGLCNPYLTRQTVMQQIAEAAYTSKGVEQFIVACGARNKWCYRRRNEHLCKEHDR